MVARCTLVTHEPLFKHSLRTIGEACLAVKSELLEQLVDWIVEKLGDDQWSMPQIKAVLAHSSLPPGRMQKFS
jgi:hypothetical protein